MEEHVNQIRKAVSDRECNACDHNYFIPPEQRLLIGNAKVNMRRGDVTGDKSCSDDRSLNSSFASARSSGDFGLNKTPRGRGRGRRALRNAECMKPGADVDNTRPGRPKEEIVMPA